MKVGPPAAAESSPSASTRRGRAAGLNEGLTLSLSSAIGSVAGLLGWIVATRLVDPTEVGEATQLVAAFGYLAVQAVCAAAVLLSPARRRPADVEVVSP